MVLGTLDLSEGDVAIEVTPLPGQQRAGVAETLQAKWEDAQPAIQKIAASFRDSLTELGDRAPNEAVLEFGLKVAAEAGWVVGKLQGEANFQIKLTWSR